MSLAVIHSEQPGAEQSGSAEPNFMVSLTRTADKAQRKLDKPLRERIKQAILALCSDPRCKGERLSQPFTTIYSHHVGYKGKEYRIAYQVCDITDHVVILLIGPHENFYRSLKNMLYAS